MSKTTQIKQYKNGIFTNILSSQFIYANPSQKCEIKGQKFFIQSKKPKKIHYLYLFLTTGIRPYLKKFHKRTKNLAKQSRVRKKAKLRTWSVSVRKNQLEEIFSEMLFETIPFQTLSEKKVLKLRDFNMDLFLHAAPLTERTLSLKSKNSYLSGIPLIWRLKWTPSTPLFQKIFVLKHLKVLNDNRQFRKLENENELN